MLIPKIENPQLKNRTVPIRGDKVRNRRKMMGWSVAELARKSFCSIKTIQSIEHNNKCYPFILNKIAKAFKIDPRKLLDDDPEESVEEVARGMLKGGIGVLIQIDDYFHKYDVVEQLRQTVESMIALAGLKGAVKVIDVSQSSILFNLEFDDEDDVIKLVSAFTNYKLDELQVDAISVPIRLVPVEKETDRWRWEIRVVRNESDNIIINRNSEMFQQIRIIQDSPWISRDHPLFSGQATKNPSPPSPKKPRRFGQSDITQDSKQEQRDDTIEIEDSAE